MQTSNRLFDDFARVASGAFNTLSGLREEIETRVRERVERMAADLDLVTREEFDAVRAVATKARTTQEELEAKIAKLEAQIAAADLLVLTKTDLVDSSTADAAQSRLRSLAPASPVIDGSLVRREPGALGRFLAIGGHRNRDAAGVPGPSLFDLHQTHTVPLRDPLTRADIEALVSDLRTSFDGRTVARAKGIVELVDGNGPRLALVQLVGPRYEITPLLPNEHQRPTDLVVITVSPTDPA